ncbi:hypothetical protein [uncultured Gemella sp.]|uniref:hypothetical protein n=1 Tax=uncultured Gemella sp. TaxID=254352 RepID=UPI0028D1F24A|nr:hypothetical protein [uncultured Gemella sp.]
MQVTIDKDILELLNCLNTSEEELESIINTLLIEGIDSITSSEAFTKNEEKQMFIKLKLVGLKLKYMFKMLKDLNDD